MKKNYLRAAIFLLKYPGIAAVCTACLTLLYPVSLRFTGNFHVVADGSLYRSAQPSRSDLQRYAHDWGIRSVVNLRGEGRDRVEQDEASQLGVRYFHIPLAADQLWSASEITGVMKVLADAPKPVLIHSQFGADRAGLASAIYLLTIAGKSPEESSEQLSPKFGHLPFLGSPTTAMDDTFKAIVTLYAPRDGMQRTDSDQNRP